MKREIIYTKFIQNIELFNGFEDEELNVLVDSLKKKTYKKGELLFEENGPRKDIFIIYKGNVELFKTPHFGSETKLSYFNNGDFLGEGSWASDSPHSTSARALSNTTVFSITASILKTIQNQPSKYFLT